MKIKGIKYNGLPLCEFPFTYNKFPHIEKYYINDISPVLL